MSAIGLDVGTSRVKAVRFDADWHPVDSEDEETTVIRGADGRREQDMHQVFEAVARVLGRVGSRSPDRVDFVAVTAQGDGCWLVDDEGEPVGTSLLWNDNRAAAIVSRWEEDGTYDRAFGVNGCSGAPGLANAQLRWLGEHDPDRLRRAATLLSCGSWIFSRLTGRRVLEESEAANPFCDARTGDYSTEVLDLFGLSDQRRLLPPIVSGGDAVAELTPTASEQVGLPPGTPIVLAPYDLVATAIGSGISAAGSGFAVIGTTLAVGGVLDDPLLDDPVHAMTLPIGQPGRWLRTFATLTGTEAVAWAARMLGVEDEAAVVRLAAESASSERPLFLPYLSPAGERSPFLDARVRGTLTGLEVAHTPADIARAVLDGIALAVLDCLRTGVAPETLSLSGGGARSELLCRTICDATGVPTRRPGTSETGALGAVVVAAAAVGAFADIEAALASTLTPGELMEPDPEATAWFDERYATFVRTRQALTGAVRG